MVHNCVNRKGEAMEYKLAWDKLLCADRIRGKSNTADNDHRSEFESDYDRVVFSTPFRRLQDKAQVFPLERNDFVRTRLTHSIEVAALARSLGISIADELRDRELLLSDELRSAQATH